jgi:arginase
VFGFRDAEEQAKYGSQPLPPALRALDLASVRRLGVKIAARQAVDHLTRPGLDGFFIHIDADSIDDALMPAVDYRIADGLSWPELRQALTIALASGKVAGLEIAIYNPLLDTDGSAGRGLVDVLAAALGTSAPGAG